LSYASEAAPFIYMAYVRGHTGDSIFLPFQVPYYVSFYRDVFLNYLHKVCNAPIFAALLPGPRFSSLSAHWASGQSPSLCSEGPESTPSAFGRSIVLSVPPGLPCCYVSLASFSLRCFCRSFPTPLPTPPLRHQLSNGVP